jgi:hypothetical protein
LVLLKGVRRYQLSKVKKEALEDVIIVDLDSGDYNYNPNYII